MKFFYRSLLFSFFIMILSMKICYASVDYSVGLDFNSLIEKEIEIGEYKHVEYDGGYEKGSSPLIWIVKKFDEQNERLLLVNKYAIDKKVYSNENKSIWESSDIRDWLENDFCNSFIQTEKVQISGLNLPFFADGKVFINENCELDDLGTTCKNNSNFESWWTKTPATEKTVIFVKGEDIKTMGTAAKATNIFVRPCVNLNLSNVVYFDESNKFSFVTENVVGNLECSTENKKINFGENLRLDLQINSDKIDNSYSVNYKIVSDGKIVLYGESGVQDKISLKTDELEIGRYKVYIWLEKNNSSSNETSEPKEFLLEVDEFSSEVNKIYFSSLVHRKNFSKDICIDIEGKNFLANDRLQIKFFDEVGIEKLCESKIINEDKEKLSINIESYKLEMLEQGNYFIKIYLIRNDEIVCEKNFEEKYVVSNMPIVSEIILSASSFNISLCESNVLFEVKFDGLEDADRIVSGNAFIFDESENEICEANNFDYGCQKKYFGNFYLPDKVSVGNYKIGVLFKIRNDFIGDEYEISGSSSIFSVIKSKLSKPKFNLPSGKYYAPCAVNLSSIENADIFYTTDGTFPNEGSRIYTSPFNFGVGNYNLKAIAIKKNYEESEVAAVDYELILNSLGSKNYADDNENNANGGKVAVENNRGRVIKIENIKLLDGSVIIFPTKQNLIDLADENKNINLNLVGVENAIIEFNKKIISDISNDFSGMQINLKDFGRVSFNRDFWNNFIDKNLSLEILHGSFVVNINVDGKNYFSSDYKDKFDASFCFADENNFEKGSFVVFKYVNGKKEIVPQSFYDDKNKVMRFKTNFFGKFDVLYNNIEFSDSNNSDVKFLAARKIINGIGENKFMPYNKVKRADFLIMLMKSFDIKIDNGLIDNFSDCSNKYFSDYIATAKKLKLINGVGQNKFGPEKFLTYHDMFNMSKKVCNVKKNHDAKKDFVSRLEAAKFLSELLRDF